MPDDLYPLSTKDAKDIPLDVIRPTSCGLLDFIAGTSSAAYDVGQASGIVLLRASVPCYVRIGGSVASVPISGAAPVPDTLYIENEIMVIYMNSNLLSVIGETAAGTLHIQLIGKWAGLGHDIQQSNL